MDCSLNTAELVQTVTRELREQNGYMQEKIDILQRENDALKKENSVLTRIVIGKDNQINTGKDTPEDNQLIVVYWDSKYHLGTYKRYDDEWGSFKEKNGGTYPYSLLWINGGMGTLKWSAVPVMKKSRTKII